MRAVPAVRPDLRGGLRTPPGRGFGKVDTEAQPALAGEFGIRSIPTIMAFRDGICSSPSPALLGEVLDELIGKLREVDMDEVRRRVSEARRRPPPRARSNLTPCASRS